MEMFKEEKYVKMPKRITPAITKKMAIFVKKYRKEFKSNNTKLIGLVKSGSEQAGENSGVILDIVQRLQDEILYHVITQEKRLTVGYVAKIVDEYVHGKRLSVDEKKISKRFHFYDVGKLLAKGIADIMYPEAKDMNIKQKVENIREAKLKKEKPIKYSVGDKVRFKKDALQIHSKIVPASSGYTKGQFSLRKMISDNMGNIGIVIKYFDAGNVNVEFGEDTIWVNGDLIELAASKAVKESDNLVSVYAYPVERSLKSMIHDASKYGSVSLRDGYFIIGGVTEEDLELLYKNVHFNVISTGHYPATDADDSKAEKLFSKIKSKSKKNESNVIYDLNLLSESCGIKKKITEAIYSIGSGGLSLLNSKTKILPNVEYMFGASSSPDHVIVTSVDDKFVHYVKAPDYEKERKEQLPIFKSFVDKGMKTWMKMYGDLKYQWAKDRMKGFESLLSGGNGRKVNIKDFQPVYVVAEPVGGTINKLWSEMERYGSVSSVGKPPGKEVFEIQSTNRELDDIKKEKKLKVILVSKERPALSYYEKLLGIKFEKQFKEDRSVYNESKNTLKIGDSVKLRKNWHDIMLKGKEIGAVNGIDNYNVTTDELKNIKKLQKFEGKIGVLFKYFPKNGDVVINLNGDLFDAKIKMIELAKYNRNVSEAKKLVSKYNTVKDIDRDQDFQFISDSQDTREIKRNIGRKAKEFDSFFVKVGDGEYDEVYGMEGEIPEMWKELTRLV